MIAKLPGALEDTLKAPPALLLSVALSAEDCKALSDYIVAIQRDATMAEREACKAKVIAAANGYAPSLRRAQSKEFEAVYGALLGVAAGL